VRAVCFEATKKTPVVEVEVSRATTYHAAQDGLHNENGSLSCGTSGKEKRKIMWASQRERQLVAWASQRERQLITRHKMGFTTRTTKQSKAKQSKAKQSKAKQSKAKQSKAKPSKAERGKAQQSKAKQSKAKQSKAERSKATIPTLALPRVCSLSSLMALNDNIHNIIRKVFGLVLAE
jgi:hypothetical protein